MFSHGVSAFVSLILSALTMNRTRSCCPRPRYIQALIKCNFETCFEEGYCTA